MDRDGLSGAAGTGGAAVMSAPLQLEIACNSLGSALAAQRGGADRIEVFADPGCGGVTPSAGVIAVVREQVQLPVFVLIRPRAGDFVYTPLEVQAMLDDIAVCRARGCDGVVIGALTLQGDVDVDTCAQLVAAAGPMQVTFHRAFDVVRDRRAALQAARALGCQRILSSGGQADALAGAAQLAADIAHASGRVAIMAGAGIHAGNVAEVVRSSGCRQVHASASALQRSPVLLRNPALAGLQPDHLQTDAARVRALRGALDGLPG